MSKPSKYISQVEIDIDNSWQDFHESCLSEIDDDFILKLCRLAFISGMMHISHVNAGFAISMSEYMRLVAHQNIFEESPEPENEN